MPAERRFLTVEQILQMHRDLLDRFGGSMLPGHRGEQDGLAAAVGAVVNSYYEDLFDLAGAYATYILLGHVFGDGNKRTASAAALTFLALNGVEIDTTPEDLLSLTLDLQRRAEAEPRPAAADLVAHAADWLRRHRRRRRRRQRRKP